MPNNSEKSTPVSTDLEPSVVAEIVQIDFDAFRARAERQIELLKSQQATMDAASVYLSTFQSAQSRRTVVEGFRRIARAMNLEEVNAYRCIPWEMVDFPFANLIRKQLAENPDIGPSTANLTLSVLRNVVKTAAMLGRIPYEQYLRVKDVKPVKGSRLPNGRALSKQEIVLLFEFCTKHGGSWGTFMRGLLAVMIGGGLRRDETCKFRLSQYHDGALYPIGKGNKEREVRLDPRSVSELDRWLRLRQLLALSHDYMFVTVRKNNSVQKDPISLWGLGNLMTVLSGEFTKYLIETYPGKVFRSITPHDMRRTFASQMLAAGMDLSMLKDQMGHADLSTTVRYDHRSKEEIASIREKIDILGPANSVYVQEEDVKITKPTLKPGRRIVRSMKSDGLSASIGDMAKRKNRR